MSGILKADSQGAVVYWSHMARHAPLTIDSLTKMFGDLSAVADVSLTLAKGEVFGFLGPNGAGKSTTIRMILGFIAPTQGSIKIDGEPVSLGMSDIKQHVGYLAGDISLYPSMTGRKLLRYLERLGHQADWAYIKELASRFEADLDKPIKSLSKGNRQKIGLIQAFMHKPELLVLDEPTSGLDPLMKQVFYDLIRETSERGATCFVSSHDLVEVQKICTRAGFIRGGKLISIEDISEATHLSTHRYIVEFDQKPKLGSIKKLDGVKIVDHTDAQVTFAVSGAVTGFIAELAKLKPVHLREQELELEELFMHYYTDKEAIS
jgi:ABC-2 type transport system ATP-binding protein